jgi:PTS system mannose-specific IID component
MKTGMLRSFLRTLLVQASWNHDRMLGLGTAHALEPLLRDLPGGQDGDRYRDAVGRGSQFFNAHPYMASFAIGALARAEHESAPPEHVDRLRRALAGPLGSLGDKLVWAGTLPAAAGVGLFVAVLATPLAGAVTFLVLYNLVHLTLRAWGLSAGWRYGIGIAKALAAPVLRRGLRVAGPAAATALGLALPPVAVWLIGDLATNARIGVALVAILGIVTARWIAPAFGGLRFGLAALAVAFLVGALWQ